MKCPCSSGKSYKECCEPLHSGKKNAPSAEALMRSRFAAFALPNGAYLMETTLPEKRKYHSQKELQEWGESNTWTNLEIITSSGNKVEFKAFYIDKNGNSQLHHELSVFEKSGENWYYVSGEFLD